MNPSGHALPMPAMAADAHSDLDENRSFFLNPYKVKARPLPLRCTPAEMLTTIENNIKAEFWAMLQEALPEKISVTLMDKRKDRFPASLLGSNRLPFCDGNDNIIVADVRRSDAGGAAAQPGLSEQEQLQRRLEDMHFHLWLLCGKLYLAKVTRRNEPIVLAMEVGTALDRPGLEKNGCYDLGYIGSFIKELAACRKLLSAPELQMKPLVLAAADPSLRMRVPYYATIPNEKDLVAKNTVPVNQGQAAALRGLAFNFEGIQGPPGTGKSTMIYHIISAALPIGTVALATCVQNRAVDAIADKLVKGGTIPFFVHGNPERLGPVAAHMLLEQQVERHPSVLRLKQLSASMTTYSTAISKFLEDRTPSGVRRDNRRHYNYSIKRAREKYPSSRQQTQRSAFETSYLWHRAFMAFLRRKYLSIFAMRQLAGSKRDTADQQLFAAKTAAEKQILREAKAVLCTIDMVGSLLSRKEYASVVGRVSTAIIDEAGTCPDNKMPLLLCLPKLDRIIAIGDQNQLVPFSYLADAKPGRAQKSLAGATTGVFQRLVKVVGPGVPMLKEQYRMHPRLGQLVSQLFYNSALKTNAAVSLQRQQASANCMTWHSCIDGAEEIKTGETSKRNVKEAEALAAWMAGQLRAKAFDDKSVMVITFYKAQAALLQSKLAERNITEKVSEGGYDVVNSRSSSGSSRHVSKVRPPTAAMAAVKSFRVTSVDQAQGSEADVVILSCVRSNNEGKLGFIVNPNRLNVAMSRARERLEIFGNEKTLCCSKKWKRLHEAATSAPVQPQQEKALVHVANVGKLKQQTPAANVKKTAKSKQSKLAASAAVISSKTSKAALRSAFSNISNMSNGGKVVAGF